MRVILLAGYKSHSDDNCPWINDSEGLPLLERRLREVRQITQNCIVVLSGDSADQILRACPSLENCELVFDTNSEKATLLSNLRAALKLGADPAVVIPADVPFTTGEKLKTLISSAVQQGLQCPYHFLQGVTDDGHLWNGGFPLLITALGVQAVLGDKELQSLADSRLQRQEVLI